MPTSRDSVSYTSSPSTPLLTDDMTVILIAYFLDDTCLTIYFYFYVLSILKKKTYYIKNYIYNSLVSNCSNDPKNKQYFTEPIYLEYNMYKSE